MLSSNNCSCPLSGIIKANGLTHHSGKSAVRGTKIITEIHITDGILTLNKIRRNLAKKDSVNYYNLILDNYGYSREDFDTSIYFYSKNINEYDEIYKEVLNRINEMETNLQEENPKKKEKEPEPEE